MRHKDKLNNLAIYAIAGYIFVLGLTYIFLVINSIEDHSVARIIGSPVQSVLLGIALVYLSSSLLKRLIRAWLITFSLISIGIVREFLLLTHSVDLTHIILLLVAGMSLWLLRDQFKARSETPKLRGALLLAAVFLSISLIYGTLGFSKLTHRYLHGDFSIQQSFVLTVKQFTLLNNPATHYSRHRADEAFLLSLRTLGFTSILLAGYSLLRPLIYRQEHRDDDSMIARELLERYGGNSEDYFKLWPKDKNYFFSPNNEAAIAYTVRNRVALSLGDPFGKQLEYDRLITQFRQFCNIHSFDMAFVQVTDMHKKLYQKHGLSLQKIGEEAIVDLNTFTTITVKNKKWRHICNKFEKLGYNFELRQPPHSATLLGELRRISDDWLDSGGRTERSFVMGYFDELYLKKCVIGIVRNDEKQIISFVNLIESFDANEANMDLFRHRQDSATNTNDYMMQSLLKECFNAGYERFNLGLCPLAGMNNTEADGALNRALRLIYNYGGRFYSFKGLLQFKSKFEPLWRERFIAIEPDAISIVRTAQALNAAMKVKQ